jgi:hypothetical protein
MRRFQWLWNGGLLALLALSAVMAGGWGGVAAAQEGQQPPSSNVVPPAGRPSTVFSFYATGFKGNERVAYWFTAPDGTVYGNEYDYRVYCFQGRADWSWRSPDNAMPGMWTAVVETMRDDDDEDITWVIPFEILPPELAAPDNAPQVPIRDTPSASALPTGAAVLPLVGPGGTEFSFYATGFDDGELVGYWFNAPDGRVYSDMYDYVTRSYDGRADWRWKSPGFAQEGVWTAVARGKESGTERVIQFEIREVDAEDLDQVPANSPGTAVEPAVGSSGSRFFFSAEGFEVHEVVYFWAASPAGYTYDKRKYKLKPNEEGAVYWNWKTPEDAAPGVWKMIVMGEDSQVQKIIYFEVMAPSPPSSGEMP